MRVNGYPDWFKWSFLGPNSVPEQAGALSEQKEKTRDCVGLALTCALSEFSGTMKTNLETCEAAERPKTRE